MSLRVQEELFLLRQEVEEQEDRLEAKCEEATGPADVTPFSSEPPWLLWAIFGLTLVMAMVLIVALLRHLYGRRYTDSVSLDSAVAIVGDPHFIVF